MDIISLDYRDTQQFKDFGEKFHFLAEYITHDWDYDYEGFSQSRRFILYL